MSALTPPVSTSHAGPSQVVESLTDAGFGVDKVIEELIVFDTYKALDEGWLEPSRSTASI